MIKYFFSLPHVPNFDPEKPMLELNHIAENVVNVSQWSLQEINQVEDKDITRCENK